MVEKRKSDSLRRDWLFTQHAAAIGTGFAFQGLPNDIRVFIPAVAPSSRSLNVDVD